MGNYRGTVNGSVQTGYFDQPFEGFPGQIMSLNSPNLIDGYPVDDSAGIFVGRGVVGQANLTITSNDYGNIPAPFSVRRPVLADAANTDFVGVAVRDSAMPNDDSGNPIWEDNTMASIMRGGRIIVVTNEAVTPQSEVWMYTEYASDASLVGAFRTQADATANQTAIRLDNAINVRFWKASPSGFAILELLPYQPGAI